MVVNKWLDEPDVDHKPSKTDPKVLPPNPTPLDLAGYMPKRGDYSTEFEVRRHCLFDIVSIHKPLY